MWKWLNCVWLYNPWNSPAQNTGASSLPNPGIEPRSPALQADSLPAEPWGKPKNTGVGGLSLLQGIFRPRIWTWESCIAGGFFNNWAIGEAMGKKWKYFKNLMPFSYFQNVKDPWRSRKKEERQLIGTNNHRDNAKHWRLHNCSNWRTQIEDSTIARKMKQYKLKEGIVKFQDSKYKKKIIKMFPMGKK